MHVQNKYPTKIQTIENKRPGSKSLSKEMRLFSLNQKPTSKKSKYRNRVKRNGEVVFTHTFTPAKDLLARSYSMCFHFAR